MPANELQRQLYIAARDYGAREPFRVASIMEKSAFYGRSFYSLLVEIQNNLPHLFHDNPAKAKRSTAATSHRQRQR